MAPSPKFGPLRHADTTRRLEVEDLRPQEAKLGGISHKHDIEAEGKFQEAR